MRVSFRMAGFICISFNFDLIGRHVVIMTTGKYYLCFFSFLFVYWLVLVLSTQVVGVFGFFMQLAGQCEPLHLVQLQFFCLPIYLASHTVNNIFLSFWVKFVQRCFLVY